MSEVGLDLFQSVGASAMTLPEVFTEPDDDWDPFAFLEPMEGDELPVIPLGPFMNSPEQKDLLANIILPGAIKKFRAKRVVLVLSVWTSRTAGEQMREGNYVAPSEQEDREEFVQLIEMTAEGVGRQSMAPIIRHEKHPPELGAWEEWPAKAKGRFVNPILKALKAVS